jgi:hypothetical protein
MSASFLQEKLKLPRYQVNKSNPKLKARVYLINDHSNPFKL